MDRHYKKRIVREGWLTDDANLWRWGFGRGAAGALKATRHFRALFDSRDPALSIRVLSSDGDPRGLFSVHHLGHDRRAVQIVPYLLLSSDVDLPVALTGLRLLSDSLFGLGKDHVFRLQAELLSSAKRERDMFKEAGFIKEGVLRDSFWQGYNVLSTVIYGYTRPAWAKKEAA